MKIDCYLEDNQAPNRWQNNLDLIYKAIQTPDETGVSNLREVPAFLCISINILPVP
jgi:hypothetical protein